MMALKDTIENIRHLLPTQKPLKDFIHHNTLHALEHLPFHEAQREARRIFGSHQYLRLSEYYALVEVGGLGQQHMDRVLKSKGWPASVTEEVRTFIAQRREPSQDHKRPRLRDRWGQVYHLDLISQVQPRLFRVLGHFLDQGISFFKMPHHHLDFWQALRTIERETWISLFRTNLVNDHKLFDRGPLDVMAFCLERLVGERSLYERYLREMCLEHPGWSGMVSVVEEHPEVLNDRRQIRLEEAMAFELLLELDFVQMESGNNFRPVGLGFQEGSEGEEPSILDLVVEVLQEAVEWTFYDGVLSALQRPQEKTIPSTPRFQVVTCIDDRAGSLRRHLEELSSETETYGTPGFFGLEFYLKPWQARHPVKLCPAPVEPQYLVVEKRTPSRGLPDDLDPILGGDAQTLTGGFLSTQVFGFWAGLRLIFNVLWPNVTSATSSSLRFADPHSSFEYRATSNTFENGLRLGFSDVELADRLEKQFRSMGLTTNFARVVLLVAHGSTTTNNPHFAAYDCGACSGRPGSVNARLVAKAANRPEVRQILRAKGIVIPDDTFFVGSIHDTTRDEIQFFDGGLTDRQNQELMVLKVLLKQALRRNARERARRFESIPLNIQDDEVHHAMRERSVMISETRPELNHANNALTIVGRRPLTKGVFLDRRAFHNSYDPALDPSGSLLADILRAVVPVCGGINLEYYFSRMDNQIHGAGTKLPHNVVGLIGVANGTEGDLKTGLPLQMVDFHEPLRLLVVVEQDPGIVEKSLALLGEFKISFDHEWMHLVTFDPQTRRCSRYHRGKFIEYQPQAESPPSLMSSLEAVRFGPGNCPIFHVARS